MSSEDPTDDAHWEGHDRLDQEPPPEPGAQRPAVEKVVVPRWIQLVTLPLLVVALYLVAKAAGVVLLAFTVAAVVALILNPIVSVLQRRRVPRGLAILTVYLGLLVVLVGAGVLLANPVADQAQKFGNDVPGIVDDANSRLADLQAYFDRKGINVEVKRQGETALQTLQEKVVGGTSDIVNFGGEILKTVVTAGLGLLLVIVLSVYMLIYGERIGAVVRSVMPPGDGSPEDDFPTRIQRAVGGYLRGQLLFSLAMGTGAGLGMYVFGATGVFPDGKTYAFAFGAWFGLMELVPFVGPFLGALPPLLVALFQDPLTAVWLGIFFTALQQLEGHVVAPYIFGHTLRINPLLVIFALLLGGEAYGFLGALLSLPMAAMLRETVVYLRRHLVLEPWGTTSVLGLAGPPPGRRCRDCGAPAPEGDAYCRACGASLQHTEVASRR
ncbi:MAG TPA: AI-2E family transporter [Baekduia sp.]|uniref:AI-2E family transporter n=1 Tax=Baekduia sp. TaxID=2600305 RepID=UPI002BBDA699|nr:AI-2E family transporter [Baekduia sp.]HMJ35645.1 AI-2E family transporter [Baekduia sp.]